MLEKLPLLNSPKKAVRIAGYGLCALLALMVLGALMGGDGSQSGLTESKVYNTAFPWADKEPIFINGGNVTVYTDVTNPEDVDIAYGRIFKSLFGLDEVEKVTAIGYIVEDGEETFLDRFTQTMTREEWDGRN
jgi:hypothetical protein